MILKHISILFALLFPFILLAQNSESAPSLYPTYKVSGAMKNKLEFASETNKGRFSVRNSRIGVSGNLTEHTSFKGQIELSDNGHFKVLDLAAKVSPLRGLTVSLGQVSIPLFNSYITTPATMLFANRAFLGKYFISTRDIGLHLQYSTKICEIPTSMELGMYNGNTINDPVWRDKLSYGARLTLGSMSGWRCTFKLYDYNNTSKNTHYIFYGADLRYSTKNWKFETEFLRKDNREDTSDKMLSYYVQGAYFYPIENKIVKKIIPALRWDAIDKELSTSAFDVNRLTAGIGFGLTPNKISSLIRIDYEWYFVNRNIDILSKYPEMDSNKITVELLLIF